MWETTDCHMDWRPLSLSASCSPESVFKLWRDKRISINDKCLKEWIEAQAGPGVCLSVLEFVLRVLHASARHGKNENMHPVDLVTYPFPPDLFQSIRDDMDHDGPRDGQRKRVTSVAGLYKIVTKFDQDNCVTLVMFGRWASTGKDWPHVSFHPSDSRHSKPKVHFTYRKKGQRRDIKHGSVVWDLSY